jgi:hypothetical protein
MTEVFDIRASAKWSFEAVASTVLAGTQARRELGDKGTELAGGPRVKPKHDAKYWADLAKGLDFSGPTKFRQPNSTRCSGRA